MKTSTGPLDSKAKLISLLKNDLSISDPGEHFRTGISTEEDIESRRRIFGANHLDKPEHDWIDLISSVIEHHKAIWLHVALGLLKCFLARQDAGRSFTMAFCFMSTIVFVALVVHSHIAAMDVDLEELHQEVIEVVRNSETHFIASHELVVGDVFLLREGSRAPCNCAVIKGRVKTSGKAKDLSSSPPHTLWRGVSIDSGSCTAIAVLVGGQMSQEEEESSFQNHHIKRNQLEYVQIVLLVVFFFLFLVMELSGVHHALATFIDIVLAFSFLSPLNLVSSKVSSSEEEDVLLLSQLCVEKSVIVTELVAVKAIGGVGMKNELKHVEKELHDFVAQIPRAEGGPDPVTCSIALNTTVHSLDIDASTAEGALATMMRDWFNLSIDEVRQSWSPHVVSRRLFTPTDKFSSCLLAIKENGNIIGGVVFSLGAADVLLARCGHAHSPDSGDRLHPRIVNLKDNACLLIGDLIDPLTMTDRHRLESKVLNYCKEGLTPMACAHRHVSADQVKVMLNTEDWDDRLDQDMTLDLITGFQNNVDKKIISQLKEFGLGLRMVTNDSLCTAVKVGNDCGLFASPIPTSAPTSVSGAYFRTRYSPLISWNVNSSSPLPFDSAPLQKEMEETHVLARATPEDKANLVKLLNRNCRTAFVTKCKKSGAMLDSSLHHHDAASLLDQLIRCHISTDNEQRVAKFQLSVLVSLLLLAIKKVSLEVPVLVILAFAVQVVSYTLRQEAPNPRQALKRVKLFSHAKCVQRMVVEVCFEWFLLSVVELTAPLIKAPLAEDSHSHFMMFHSLVFCRLSGVIGLFIDNVDTLTTELGSSVIATLLLVTVVQCYFLSQRVTSSELLVASSIGSLGIVVALLNRLLSLLDQSCEKSGNRIEPLSHKDSVEPGNAAATNQSSSVVWANQKKVSEALLKLENTKRIDRSLWEWLVIMMIALLPAYWLLALYGAL